MCFGLGGKGDGMFRCRNAEEPPRSRGGGFGSMVPRTEFLSGKSTDRQGPRNSTCQLIERAILARKYRQSWACLGILALVRWVDIRTSDPLIDHYYSRSVQQPRCLFISSSPHCRFCLFISVPRLTAFSHCFIASLPFS